MNNVKTILSFVVVAGGAMALVGCSDEPAPPPPATTHGSVADLVAQLDSDDAEQRAEACRALGKMAGRSADAAGALLAAAKDNEMTVRTEAEAALCKIAGKSPSLLHLLVAALRDPNPAVHDVALAALTAMGPSAAPAVGAVVRTVGSPGVRINHQTSQFLSRLGPLAVPGLVAFLDDPDEEMRNRAMFGLHELGADGKEALPALLEYRAGQESKGRDFPEFAILEIAAAAQDLPALAQLMTSTDISTRLQTVSEMRHFGKSAIGELEAAMEDEDLHVRVTAGACLLQQGTGNAHAMKLLTEALASRNVDIRYTAIVGLQDTGSRDKAVLEAVTRIADDVNDGARHVAAAALLKFHPTGEAHIQAYIRCLKTNTWDLSKDHWLWIEETRTVAIPSLVRIVETDPQASYRRHAVDSLGRFGPQAVSALATITKALDDPDDDVANTARLALVRAQPTADRVIALIALVKNDAKLREAYALSLLRGSAAPLPGDALRPLVQAALGKDGEVASVAIRFLVSIRPLPPSVLQTLAEALTGKRPPTPIAAVKVLSPLAARRINVDEILRALRAVAYTDTPSPLSKAARKELNTKPLLEMLLYR